jgi:hypothetical protein
LFEKTIEGQENMLEVKSYYVIVRTKYMTVHQIMVAQAIYFGLSSMVGMQILN